MRAALLGLAALGLGLSAPAADARVVRLDVDRQEVVANGQPFGAAGAYEKLTGRVHFEVDPADERNARVFDLERAPRNARGRVAFSADFYVLKPVDMARASGTLLFEVNNRGRKIAFMRFHDTPSHVSLNDPSAPEDFGNGFFMKRGHVVAWVGWGADIAPGDHRLTVDFPKALIDGKPVVERILTEFGDRNFGGESPVTLPLSGSPAFHGFPTLSVDKSVAEAELWVTPSDSPRPNGPGIPRGEKVPDTDWAFAACPQGWPGTPSRTDICLRTGFRNERNYHLLYRAEGSPVMGLGYLTTRDFVSFLRRPGADGPATPVPGLDTALCLGISSSGMYLRDFLYQGFNEDEQGRRVCDGMHIHVAGVHKLFLNYRFAQPNPFSQQHRERWIPDTNFPHQYGVRGDPLTRVPDGILKRPSTDPKVIHTDTSNEYWQFRASLTGTTEGGRLDLTESPRVRRFLLSSLQHGGHKGDPPGYGIGNRQCEQRSNPLHPGPMLRALFVSLEDWVREDRKPPESRVPRIDDGTLVDPGDLAWPGLPAVTYAGLLNGSGERDFGPRAQRNRGVIDKLFPDVKYPHHVLVPQVDPLGHDIAGIRHPLLEVPVATYLGWNTRRAEFGGNDLCDLLGSRVPLPHTGAEALALGDPRPPLLRLYRDETDYVAQVRAAALGLVEDRLLLPEDVARVTEDAQIWYREAREGR